MAKAYEVLKTIGAVDHAVQKINNKISNMVLEAKTIIFDKVGPLSYTGAVDISGGGVRSGFDKEACQTSLKHRKKHSSGNSIFAFNWFSTPARCAHISESKLMELVADNYNEPFDDIKHTLHGALPPCRCAAQFLGNLMVTSPPEIVWAPIIGLSGMIRNESISDEDIQRCVVALQNVEVTMQIYSSAQEVLFDCHKKRRDLEKTGVRVKPTALQKVYHILQAREMIGEKATVAECCRQWQEEGKDKDMTTGEIDAAFTVNDRLLTIPETKELLLIADSSGIDNPFSESIYKCEAVIKRAKKPLVISWSIGFCLDLLETGRRVASDFSLRSLVGKGHGASGRGLIDRAIVKYEAGELLLAWGDANIHLPESDAAVCRGWLKGHKNYRNHLNGNISWVGARPKASRKFLELFEEMIFGFEFDEELEDAKINHMTLNDAFKKSPIKDRLDLIVSSHKEQTMGKPDAAAASADDVEENAVNLSDVGPNASESDEDPPPPGSAKKVKGDEMVVKWVDFGKRKWNETGKFVVFPGSVEPVAEIVAGSSVGKLYKTLPNLVESGNIGVLYDHKSSGESNSRPHVRLVAFRDDFACAGVKGVMKGLGGELSDVPKKLVFFMMDGGVLGNEIRLTRKTFTDAKGKALSKEKKRVFVSKTETSAKANKKLVRGPGNVEVVELMYVISNTPVDTEEKQRFHFPNQTNRSNLMGPFDVPAPTEKHVLKCLHKDKAQYYCIAFRECGGTVAADPGTNVSQGPKSADTVPMQWFMNSGNLFEEISHGYDIVGWINLAESDGTLAFHCAQTNRPYLGLTHTAGLKDLLQKHTENRVLCAMQDVGDPLHEPELVQLLEEKKNKPEKEKDQEGSQPATPKAKAKGKRKSKSKPKPKAGEDLRARLKALDGGDGGSSNDDVD